MNWYLKAWKYYAEFSGRARRQEYWTFVLLNILFIVVAYWLADYLSFKQLPKIYNTAIFIPSWAVTVRRLHDVNKSGWSILVLFVPIIGPFWLLFLLTFDGTRGRNRYGDDPKGEEYYTYT